MVDDAPLDGKLSRKWEVAAGQFLPVLTAGAIALLSQGSAHAQALRSPSDLPAAGAREPTTAAAPPAPETEPNASAPASATEPTRPVEPEPQPKAPSAPAAAPESETQPQASSSSGASPKAPPTACAPCACAAEAKGPPQAPVDESRPESGYGLTMAIADLINVGTHTLIGVWGVADPDKYKKSWPYTLTGVYVVTGPLVHLTKQRPDRAWKSLALRVGIPLGTGLIGLVSSLDRTDRTGGLPRNALVGGVLGMGVAVFFDDIVLSGADTEDLGTELSGIQGVGPWVDLERRAAGASLAYAL
ncbi:MAG: hypothetical protein JW940_26365 [Polyangiaceae bacterium]|nr:hypothetical protein [Polyangiaceae bacterium]